MCLRMSLGWSEFSAMNGCGELAAYLTLPLVGRGAGRREGFSFRSKVPSSTPPHKGEGLCCRTVITKDEPKRRRPLLSPPPRGRCRQRRQRGVVQHILSSGSWHHPHLSAPLTSSPQGGRGETAALLPGSSFALRAFVLRNDPVDRFAGFAGQSLLAAIDSLDRLLKVCPTALHSPQGRRRGGPG